MSFGGVFDDFSIIAIGACEDVYRKSAVDLFTNIIKSTPVQDGRAKANWRATIKKKSTAIVDYVDPTGSGAISRVNKSVSRAKGDTVLYLTNNLPYIEKLENGYSPQAAPGEMVQLNVRKARMTLKKVARAKR